MGELGKRVAVAALGIPVVLGAVWLGGWYVAVPLAAFAGWGAHECYRFAAARGLRPLEGIGIPLAASFPLLAGWRPAYETYAPFALGVLAVAVAATLVVSLGRRGPDGQPLAAASVTIAAALYVGLLLSFAPLLHALPTVDGWSGDGGALAGMVAVALPLAATWIGDAAAYFAGSAWGRGRRRLAPSISPNKSWVGFWAALAGGAFAGMGWLAAARSLLGDVGFGAYPTMALAGAVLGLVAVLGDLVESLLKREAGVKDSGTFFPGHGGVMDRIDSLLLTIPTAYVLLLLLRRLS